MGFAGGFASLLVLRIMLGVGESIAFPGSSKIIARHVPPERRGLANAAVATGLALGPAVGTLAGGLIVASLGWRAMFFVFGIATLIWLLPWRQTVRALPTDGLATPGGARPARRAAPEMAAVVDVDRPLPSAIIASISCSPGCRSTSTKSRGFTITEMTLLATLGYRSAGGLRFGLRPFLGLVDPLGPIGGGVPALDDGRQPGAGRRRDPRPRLRHDGADDRRCFCASPAPRRPRCRSISMPSRRCSPGRAPPAPGSASRTRSAICRAFSDRSSPASSSIAPATTAPSIVTAAVAAFGALWWAFAVPHIEPGRARLTLERPTRAMFRSC